MKTLIVLSLSLLLLSSCDEPRKEYQRYPEVEYVRELLGEKISHLKYQQEEIYRRLESQDNGDSLQWEEIRRLKDRCGSEAK